MVQGYPPVLQPRQSMVFHGQPHFGKSYVSDDNIVKLEDECPTTQAYYPNGGYLDSTTHRNLPFYPPPHYQAPTYSSAGNISTNSFGHHGDLAPPPAYDQFRIAPPVSTETHAYWDNGGKADEQYDVEPPTKRSRYSSGSCDTESV